MSHHIHAVTVNHNTSHFVELMLRTLFLLNAADSFRLDVTVLDNASNDEHLPALQAYLAAQDISFQQTGFDTTIAGEKHGIAFQTFISSVPNATHYLFLDADMWFIERNTIGTMLDELNAADINVFANQARIYGYYAGRIIEGRDGIPGARDVGTFTTTFGGKEYVATPVPRCSPVCALVKNTLVFWRVVETFGFTPALRFRVDAADWYDTFALMTRTLETHGQPFMVSSKTVNHFTQASYMPEHRDTKDNDCLALLDDLRAGRGMANHRFIESDWVRQQSDIHTT